MKKTVTINIHTRDLHLHKTSTHMKKAKIKKDPQKLKRYIISLLNHKQVVITNNQLSTEIRSNIGRRIHLIKDRLKTLKRHQSSQKVRKPYNHETHRQDQILTYQNILQGTVQKLVDKSLQLGLGQNQLVRSSLKRMLL